MVEKAPWDPPDTPAVDLGEAQSRFLAAARALKDHHEGALANGKPHPRTKLANRIAWLSLDYGYQMITGQHLPADLEVTQ